MDCIIFTVKGQHLGTLLIIQPGGSKGNDLFISGKGPIGRRDGENPHALAVILHGDHTGDGAVVSHKHIAGNLHRNVKVDPVEKAGLGAVSRDEAEEGTAVGVIEGIFSLAGGYKVSVGGNAGGGADHTGGGIHKIDAKALISPGGKSKGAVSEGDDAVGIDIHFLHPVGRAVLRIHRDQPAAHRADNIPVTVRPEGADVFIVQCGNEKNGLFGALGAQDTEIVLLGIMGVTPEVFVVAVGIGRVAPAFGENRQLCQIPVRQDPYALHIAVRFIGIFIRVFLLHTEGGIIQLADRAVKGDEDQDILIDIILPGVFLCRALRNLAADPFRTGAVYTLIRKADRVYIINANGSCVGICIGDGVIVALPVCKGSGGAEGRQQW